MRLAIVAEGGGLRGAYALGAIDALYSHFGLKRADVVTGSSGSIGTLIYYAGGQFYPGFYIWPENLPDSRFLSPKNILRGEPFLNIDFLVDDIVKKSPKRLDMSRVLDSEVELIVPLTDAETGEAVYLSNKNAFNGLNPWEVLKASMAEPIAYRRSIRLNGRGYLDGAYSDPLPVEHESIRAARKIIILTKSPDYPLERGLLETFSLYMLKPFLTKQVYEKVRNHKRLYKEKLAKINELEMNGDIVIRPSQRFSKLDNSREKIEEAIREGRKDALSNEQLSGLLESLKDSEKSGFYFG